MKYSLLVSPSLANGRTYLIHFYFSNCANKEFRKTKCENLLGLKNRNCLFISDSNEDYNYSNSFEHNVHKQISTTSIWSASFRQIR